jgi:broad specificity phosphatase PhoE
MKKLNKKQEFEKMQKMYNNCAGLKDKMDFATFTFKYYDDMIKKYEECRDYWGSTEWHKFMEEAEKEAEKPADATEETPEDEIARLKAKIAELEAAQPEPEAAKPVKKRVIVVRKKPEVSSQPTVSQ